MPEKIPKEIADFQSKVFFIKPITNVEKGIHGALFSCAEQWVQEGYEAWKNEAELIHNIENECSDGAFSEDEIGENEFDEYDLAETLEKWGFKSGQ